MLNIIKEITSLIKNQYPDFKDEEIRDLCSDYLCKIGEEKTKKEKIKILLNYVKKDFGIIMENKTNLQSSKNYSLDKIPKFLLEQNNLYKNCLFNLSGVTKSISDKILFENTNIILNNTDKISLIGRNGSGKSTLLRIINGNEDIDHGEIIKFKGIKIGFLSQDIMWKNEERTLQEEMLTTLPEITNKMQMLDEINLLLNKNSINFEDLLLKQTQLIEELNLMNGYKMYELQTEILKYFGFTEKQFNQKISKLSGGEQIRVQIAKFLLQKVDLLILDEPTNHLDIEGILFLEKFLKKWNKAIICVSHDKKFINGIFNKIWEIFDKKIVEYFGNYDFYLFEKQKTFDLQFKKHETQKKYIQEQQDFINKNRAKKSKAGVVQGRIKMLEKMKKIDKPTNEKNLKEIKIKLNENIPNLLVSLEKVGVGYNQILFEINDKLSITKNKSIGIIGKNGIGKTTLLKTIIGEVRPLHGEIFINQNLKIAYYSQISENLDSEKTIIQELCNSGNYEQKEIRSILGGLLIIGDTVNQKIKTLSGGERAKVALTKIILQKPHLLIMDEPTNHLDIFSKETIKKMLKDFGGVSIIASHDRDFLENTINELWLIKDGEIHKYQDIEEGFKNIL